jgi:hypothetical protein
VEGAVSETPRAVFADLLEHMIAAERVDSPEGKRGRREDDATRAEWMTRFDAAAVASTEGVEPPADEGDLEALHGRILFALGVPSDAWPADVLQQWQWWEERKNHPR